MGGHTAIDEYEGEYDGEMVKLSDFFRSEQAFNEFLNRLKNVEAEFRKRRRA